MTNGSSGSTTQGNSARVSTIALLWLDPEGRIRFVNTAVRALWRADEAALVDSFLVDRLAWEITSTDLDWKQAQWDALRSAACGCAVRALVQPVGGGDAIPVSLTLEPATGGGSGFFAAVSVADAPEAPAPSEPSPPVRDNRPPSETEPPPVLPALKWLATESPVGVFDLDFDLGYAHYSPAWKRMLGYEEADLPDTFETWRHLLHEDDSAAAPDRIGVNPGHVTARSFALDFRMRHRRGHPVWMHCIGVQHFGPGGRLARVLGIQFDITDRKELEEETLGAEERLRHLTSQGLVGAFDLDFIKRSHWFSTGWRSLFAQPEMDPARPNDPLWPLLDVLPAEHATAGASWLSDYRAGESPLVEAITLKRQDGVAIPVLLGLTRHFSRRQDLQRVVGFAIPLAADATSMRIGRTLPPVHLIGPALDALTEALIVADASGNVSYLNARAESLTSRTARGGGILTLDQALPLVRRSDLQPAQDAIATMLASADPEAVCLDHALGPCPDRTEPLPVVWNARRIWDARGRIAGVVVVIHDPRETSLKRDEVIRTNRMETLGRLAHGIASDYNNLLTTILGAISQARENRDLSHLASAEKACLEASGLSRQLMMLARPDPAPGRTACAIADVAHDAVRLASSGCTARIILDFPDNLPQVQGERSELLQALQNLVLNAIEALPEDPANGLVRLRGKPAHLENNDVPPLPAGDYVQIEVQDNGSGIAPETLEHIFEPFFSSRPHHTGLGLATVQSIVRRHGGQVTASSLPNEGATFTLFLPANPSSAEAPPNPRPALRFGTGRVLFMDDDPAISALSASMLTSLDYTYDLARNGEEALALYRRYLNVGRPYDAVILDVNIIGGMGGEDCFAELQRMHPDVRAIIASGYDDPNLRERFEAMGFAAYLTKPYRLGDLGRAIQHALGSPENRFSPG